MYISIRHFKDVESPKNVTEAVNERFFPLLSALPGFVAYYGIETGKHSWASINIFQSPEEAEACTKVGLNFAKDLGITTAPEIIAGKLVALAAVPEVHEIMVGLKAEIEKAVLA
jgi:hypothetical protein